MNNERKTPMSGNAKRGLASVPERKGQSQLGGFETSDSVSSMDQIKPHAGRGNSWRRILLFALPIAVIGSGYALLNYQLNPSGVDGLALDWAIVQRGEFRHELRAPGEIIANQSRWVASDSEATVDRIFVEQGATVSAGALLMQLTNPQLVEAVSQADLAIAAAIAAGKSERLMLQRGKFDALAALASAEADYERARLQYEAEKELIEENIISALQLKRSQILVSELRTRVGLERSRLDAQQESIDAQLELQRVKIRQLKEELQHQQQKVAALRLISPAIGIVQAINVEEGQQVGEGDNLALIAETSELMVRLRIPQSQAVHLGQGLTANMTILGQQLTGQVARIDPFVKDGIVIADISTSETFPAGSRLGLTVNGQIEIRRIPDTHFVERPVYAQPDKKGTIFQYNAKAKRAVRVPVAFGAASYDAIEIIDGLSQGDIVLISDPTPWNDEDAIEVEL